VAFADGAEHPAKVDITLYVQETADGLRFDATYDADLFDAPRIDALLRQLAAVLRQAVADPTLALDAISLRTDGDARVLPDPGEPLSAEWRGSVPALFARRAAEAPDALAIEDPRERWSYAELERDTDCIARALADAGVGAGEVVAIWAHRSAGLVRALLGTLRSGAAFLVLDPAYPPQRIVEYLRIARPAAFLRPAAAAPVPAEVEAALAETVRHTGFLAPKSEVGDGPVAAPEVEIGPDSLAYLSFTSGTTGVPKAVMGRHGSLTHFTPWLAETFGLGRNDRFSLLSGLAHDPLHRDVFTPLQLGAAVVAPDPDEIGTPGYLATWLRQAGVSIAHLTPAMGRLVTAVAADVAEVPSLRRAFYVGDVLTRADVAHLRRLAPGVTVINYYGSTETQRAVGYHVVGDGDEAARPVVPLGRGIPGVQLLVRTASGALAGVGEVGEVWLRSPHVALGYLGDAALTAQRFVPNPWRADSGDVLYRTGDLGRYRPDGEVEPAGRADRQVQVRGFRVEPGEVEAVLAAHPDVRAAAVVPRLAVDGGTSLVAYVVSAVDDPAAALRPHLAARLPDYMVPSAFVTVDALPLTANGKLDVAALPAPPASPAAAHEPPRTAAEQVVAEIWGEVLGKGRVGVEDDFFALGGHSLLATRVLSRVEQAFGVKLPVRALFEHPTVAALAVRLESAAAGTLADALAELDALSEDELMALLEAEGA
jgi:amino acid adenylation domain-containing protein